MQKSEQGRQTRRDIVELLRDFKRSKGYLPMLGEIAEQVGVSRTTLSWHMQSLKDQGYIDYVPGEMARTLRVKTKDLAGVS